MASIDGFLDHFDAEAVPRPAMRASLRRLQSRDLQSRDDYSNEVRERVLLWMLVALLHLPLILALRTAMQPLPFVRRAIVEPLQITFIQWTAPPMPRAVATSPPPAQHVAHSATRSIQNTTQTITPAPHKENTPLTQAVPVASSASTLSRLVVYDIDGRVRVPTSGVVAKPVDPFRRRAATDMLPGSDRVVAPGIRMRAEMTPQKVVERIGALFGGGHVDPCPEYEERLLNTDNDTERDEQMDRYARACPGR